MERVHLEVLPDRDAATARAAALIAEAARAAVERRGSVALAFSRAGGRGSLFERLSGLEVPWERCTIWQVDERVAPDGDDDRNLTAMLVELPGPARDAVRPMPVTEDDLEAAAARYAAELPARLDVVHLGLGGDGHTASLVPGDPVLDLRERAVGVTGEYENRRRMTLTYPALDAAELVVWLVTGTAKADPLAGLLDRDPGIPGGRVRAGRQVVVADAEARP